MHSAPKIGLIYRNEKYKFSYTSFEVRVEYDLDMTRAGENYP